MRLLAERAQTGTATLYRHVAGKEELLVYAVDALFAEALLEEDDGAADGDRPPTWQEAARAVSLRFHRLLAHHPNLVPLLVAQVPIGPRGLVMREQTLATLTGYGFSTRVAARAYTALAHYVVGFAIQQQSAAGQKRESEALRGYYRALDPAAFGATVAAADDLTTVSSEEEFLEGLDFMLEGINRARVEGRPTASG